MRYEAYVLKDNPREKSVIHRELNRVGTWAGSNGLVDVSLADFIKSLVYDVHNKTITNKNIIVYATNYVKLNLNNDDSDGEVTVAYRHPVYVGTVNNYKDNNNLLNEIYSLQII